MDGPTNQHGLGVREEGAVPEASLARPQLFDVLRRSAASTPFQTPVGIDGSGRAIWLDLHHASARHVLIVGGARQERAEMLRTLAVGLASTTRPALLQILGIDLGGRELAMLDSLPHAVTDLATDPASAQVSLIWLASELDARTREGRLWPEMLLVVEDLFSLSATESGKGRSALTRILRGGGRWGIHILGASASLTGGLKSAGWNRADVGRLSACEPRGWFTFSPAGGSAALAGLQVCATDLDLVARGGRLAGRSVLPDRRPSHPHRVRRSPRS